MMLGRRRLSALAVPAFVGACGASPDPVLYTVAVRPGPTFPGGPRVIQLRDIGLASYLDRKEIVRSSEDYKLGVMANSWWGESLGALLGRVLVVELSQRLPNSKVYSESGAINADPNAVLGINIQRLDTDSAGNLVRPGGRGVQPAPTLGVAQLRHFPPAADAGRDGPGGGHQRRRGRTRRWGRGPAAALDAARRRSAARGRGAGDGA